LTVTLVRELPIFVGSDRLEEAVASAITHAYRHADKAAEWQLKAEITLLTSLGLADWTPPEPLSYIARASDAFAAGRVDSRFFAPRIQALLDILNRDECTVGDLAAPRRQKFRPTDCDTFHYITLSSRSPSKLGWRMR
jgi:type I restriction enzyme, S subunit